MFFCKECGNESVKWQGQCSFCKAWNSLAEVKEQKQKSQGKKGTVGALHSLGDIEKDDNNNERIQTKSSELNNVLGGGIVEGSVVLLSGEPGIGKSTLTLQFGSWVEESIIYVSGEETQSQIHERAIRLGVKNDQLSILGESSIENILETLKAHPSKVVIIDSISVMRSDTITGASGSISQVRYITELLVDFAKTTNTTIFIIGHITKDGNLAGPKTLEHMVDTVLFFEGDKYDNLRILRALKNRFGATSEIAIFKMLENGLQDLKNPGLEFINSHETQSIGSSLSITMEGTRPIVVETESLTNYTKFGYPKRSTRGVSSSKLDLIVAVLGKYTKIKLESSDVYSNISRGLKIDEPGIDLSLCASIISSKLNKVIPKDMIFIGEISLTGNIRNIMHLEQRLKEAAKMGFKTVVIPKNSLQGKYDIEIKHVSSIKNLVDLLQ
ncbi:MAG: DNA repair protein RadA [Candidatus Gracilibacteria bacterium]|nr:DNA repair protein RadA [Candidatus Gracilibacteria bacterium]